MFLVRANARDAQNECGVSMLRKLGNICCGHKMFLEKIRNIFCVRNKCCARGQTGKHFCRQQCVLVCQRLKFFKDGILYFRGADRLKCGAHKLRIIFGAGRSQLYILVAVTIKLYSSRATVWYKSKLSRLEIESKFLKFVGESPSV